VKSVAFHCVCGSTATFTDAAEAYISPKTGAPDSKGRRFLIEVRADEWLQRHAKCVDAQAALTAAKAKALAQGKQ